MSQTGGKVKDEKSNCNRLIGRGKQIEIKYLFLETLAASFK